MIPARGTFLLLCLLLASLAAPAAADTLTGRVLNANGSPVSGVDLDFENLGPGGDPLPSQDFTRSDGTFATIVPAGTYRVIFDPASTYFKQIVEPVVIAGVTDIGDIVLPKAVKLSGTLTRSGGAPVANANLDVIDAVTDVEQPISDDFTTATGAFSIVVPVGQLEVEFDPPAGGPLLVPLLVEVALSKNTNLGTLVMELGSHLTARLERAGGQPVVDADTDVRDNVTDEKLFTPGDNSDAAGDVDVVVPDGTYEFSAQPNPADGLVAVEVRGVVVIGDTDLGVITLQAGVHLSGTVIGNGIPLPGIDLDLHDPVTGAPVPLAFDNTDASGRYDVIVPIGTWDVTIRPVGGESFAPSTFEDVVISADTVLDAMLLPCATPCAGPTLSSLLPPAGPPAGGNQVVLRGANFVDDGSAQVLFGGAQATITSITAPQTIVVTAPAGAVDTAVAVTVNSSAGAEVLPDAYTYGDLTIEFGQKVEGALPVADVDRIFAEAVAGSALTLKLKPVKGGTLQPQLRVVAPDGEELLAAADSIITSRSAGAKKLPLGLTGLYTLELSGASGSTGGYQLSSKLKIPKSVKTAIVVDGSMPTATLSFGARAGWTLTKASVASKPRSTAPFGPFPPGVALVEPDGTDVDLTGLTNTNAKGTTVSVSDVPLGQFGTWHFQVSSQSAVAGQATVKVKIKAPKVPKLTVVEAP